MGTLNRSQTKMNMVRLALSMLAMTPLENQNESRAVIGTIGHGGNPQAGNYFRTKSQRKKKVNRLHLSRKAKVARRKAA